MVCTLLAGVNVVAFAADDVQTVPVAKFYNDAKKGGDGEHLFTKDQDEMSWLTSLPTWNNEGVAWKAPVSSSTSVYRCYNPNSGEHLYVDEDYADYLAATGWNKEKVAFYSDDEMGVPVYRLWNGQDGVGSHHFTTDEGEVDWLVSQGWTKEDIAFFGVDDGTIVKSAELIDESGLQTDGTAYYKDTLRVTYTADLGNPTQITWYKDGTAVLTSTASSIGGLAFTVKPNQVFTTGNPAGTWYAVITNTKGETYASNTLEVTKVAAPAVISELTFSQDYTYGVDKNNGTLGIDYASTTDKIIATFKVNKDYDGTFGAVDAKKVAAGNVTVGDILASAATYAFDTENTQSQFTDAEALEDHHLDGYAGSKFVNKDGSVVYKWVVDKDDFETFAGTLERGESYVIGFIQEGVSTASDPKTYIVAGPVVAPYVDAPAAVAVTKAEADKPIELAFVDAEGNKLEWMGSEAAVTGASIDVGIQNAIMYKNTENVAGKGTNLNNDATTVLKGALVSTNAKGDSNFQYYSATVTFKKGIYGDKQLTLTSPTKTIATSSMKAMSLYNNQSAPTTATIKFNNLVTSGMVAVLHTDLANAQDDIKAVSQGDMSKITGMAQVARGTSKVDIEDAIDSVDDTVAYDLYVPLFLPDNAEEYTAVYPGREGLTPQDIPLMPGGQANKAMMDIPDDIGNVTKALVNTQVETFFSLASNVSKMNITTGATITVTLKNGQLVEDNTGNMNLLEVYDQYGDELEASERYDEYVQALTNVPFELKKTSSLPTPRIDNLIFTVGQFGQGGPQELHGFTGFTLVNMDDQGQAVASGIDNVANSTWQATTPAGQTITVKFDANSDMTVTISGLL